MPGPTGREGSPIGDVGQPSVSADADPLEGPPGDLPPAEAFQTLASEVRIAVLLRLRSAERADETPLSFSELQRAADADSSAGFAYHLRQLDGHFVSQRAGGYVLTPAGRRAAEAVLSGAFTATHDRTRAS